MQAGFDLKLHNSSCHVERVDDSINCWACLLVRCMKHPFLSYLSVSVWLIEVERVAHCLSCSFELRGIAVTCPEHEVLVSER